MKEKNVVLLHDNFLCILGHKKNEQMGFLNAISHVTRVAKVQATLIGSLVRSHLKGNDSLALVELLLGKLTDVLLGFRNS